MNTFVQVFRCFIDTIFAYWFFKPVQKKEEKNRQFAVLVLFFTLPLYLVSGGDDFAGLTIRFVFRAMVYVLYLYLAKDITVECCFYYGILIWLAFTAENNIFLTPQLSALRRNQIAFTAFPFINAAIGQCIEYLMEFFILAAVSRTAHLNKLHHVNYIQWGMATVAVGCELYIKYTLYLISASFSKDAMPELTVYPILMQILLLLAIILLEMYLYNNMLRQKQQLNDVANNYRYQNAKAKNEADESIRRMHHDMKNHLIAIQTLSHDNENLDAYINRILQEVENYEALVQTGNPILNGLISEKIHAAHKHNIEINACIDFRKGSFIENIDLCSIFGNALDNAIEASTRVKDPDKRSILVKCDAVGGNLVISFQNYYEGVLKQQGHWFASSKESTSHGIGLSSIQHAAQNYGGIVTAQTDELHNFILTVLLPLPAEKK